MKKIIPLFLSSCIFLSLTTRVFVSGHATKYFKTTAIPLAKHQVILKYGKTIIARTLTDKKGYYAFDFLDTFPRTDTFKFYLVATDTLLLKSLTKFESDSPVIDLYILKK